MLCEFCGLPCLEHCSSFVLLLGSSQAQALPSEYIRFVACINATLQVWVHPARGHHSETVEVEPACLQQGCNQGDCVLWAGADTGTGAACMMRAGLLAWWHWACMHGGAIAWVHGAGMGYAALVGPDVKNLRCQDC